MCPPLSTNHGVVRVFCHLLIRSSVLSICKTSSRGSCRLCRSIFLRGIQHCVRVGFELLVQERSACRLCDMASNCVYEVPPNLCLRPITSPFGFSWACKTPDVVHKIKLVGRVDCDRWSRSVVEVGGCEVCLAISGLTESSRRAHRERIVRGLEPWWVLHPSRHTYDHQFSTDDGIEHVITRKSTIPTKKYIFVTVKSGEKRRKCTKIKRKILFLQTKMTHEERRGSSIWGPEYRFWYDVWKNCTLEVSIVFGYHQRITSKIDLVPVDCKKGTNSK